MGWLSSNKKRSFAEKLMKDIRAREEKENVDVIGKVSPEIQAQRDAENTLAKNSQKMQQIKEVRQKEDEKQEILTHEQTHVRQWHSIDVIISEIVNIICWMNPFAWLLKTEIRLNLEYLADHKVMESGTNKKAYQYHLLGLANQNRQTGLYNNFNLSHLKNRIKMMNKRRTKKIAKTKYLLFAPLAAALLFCKQY